MSDLFPFDFHQTVFGIRTQITYGDRGTWDVLRDHGQVDGVRQQDRQTVPDLLSGLNVQLERHGNQESHQHNGEHRVQHVEHRPPL